MNVAMHFVFFNIKQATQCGLKVQKYGMETIL